MGLFEDFKKNELPNDLSDKIFVITGTTSGTGYVAAKTAGELGGIVFLLNRPSSRSDEALSKLQEEVPNGKFTQIDCDLQDFQSVKAAADEILSTQTKIYCLANNAGIMDNEDEATKDGYDIQMQTNHLSHFLLTSKLFPLLIEGAKQYKDARIVQHSSNGRHYCLTNNKLEEQYLGKNGGNLGGNATTIMDMKGPNMQRYCQTKLANSVFMYALKDKIDASTKDETTKLIKSIACHPGIAPTNLMKNPDQMTWIQRVTMPIVTYFMFNSVEEGSMGLIKCMASQQVESGVLYGPDPSKWRGEAVPNPPKEYETDPESKTMLWKMSEDATGIKFDIP